jgi:glutathione S-transferase kappa 1
VIGEYSVVEGRKGKEGANVGINRFHFMWEYLGLPWQDIDILPKGGEKAKL